MNLRLNPHRGQRGAVFLLIILVLVFTIVLVGVLFYVMVKAIHKIKPPPDGSGTWTNPPKIGSRYDGGTVSGYLGSINNIAPIEDAPTNFIVDAIYIYAGDTPVTMTNLVWGPIPFLDIDSYIDDRGIPMEQWPDGQQPGQRFYRVTGEGHLE
jgi:hypothetical protein